MNAFFKKYYLYILYILLILSCILLSFENLSKSVFLIVIFSCWFVFSLKRSGYTPTLLFLFLLTPFNITFQIPESSIYSQQYIAGFWVNYLVPTLSILDVFVLLLLIQLYVYRVNFIKKILIDKYLLVFFVLLLIQNLFVHNFLTVLLSLRIFVYLFTSIVLILSLVQDFKVKKLLRNGYLILALALSILLQGVIGIYQFLKGTSIGLYFLGESKIVSGMYGSSYIDIQGEAILRSYGTFPHPNILAGWYLFIFLLCIYIYSKTKERIYLIYILLIPFFTLFTFSRLSILLLFLFLVIFSIKYIFKRYYMFSISSLLFYRFINILNGDDSSWSDRVKLLRLNIEILKENILLGSGLGRSLLYYEKDIPFTSGGKLLLQPVHNIWILNWVEFGILLGTYYLYILYRFFLRGLKINLYRALILVTILVIGMFDHYLFTLPQGNVLFFSFLILLSDLKR